MRTVDVSNKPKTLRSARAYGRIRMSKDTVRAIREGRVPKGDVLSACRLAGLMASKKTSELLPFCHPVSLEHVELDVRLGGEHLEVFSYVKGVERTGYEMEALTAVSLALLTVYDMCKGLDQSMVIEEIRLLEKRGGKSDWAKSLEGISACLEMEEELRAIAEEYLKGAGVSIREDGKVLITTKAGDMQTLQGISSAVNFYLFSLVPHRLREGVLVGKRNGRLVISVQKDKLLLRCFFENFLHMIGLWLDGETV